MLKIIPNEKGIVIHLEGIKEILSLKGEIKIPWKSIKRISSSKPKWLIFTPRIGTNLPGVLMAGTFYRVKGKSFYFVRHLDRCITFTLEDHQFAEIVIEVKDKEKQIERLRNLKKKYNKRIN